MGKVGFSPIIGLAVVVALAMAAVFGAMSLANPAFASTPSGLKATGAASSVILTFKDQTDIDGDEWQVQYRENEANISYSDWLEASDTDNVAIAEADDVVTITVSVLSDGSEYCFRVRENDNTQNPLTPSGAAGPVCAIPNEAPDTTEITTSVSVGDDGGTLEVDWDSVGSKQDAWQYRVGVTLIGGTLSQGSWKMVPGVTNDDEGEFVISNLESVPTTVTIRAVAVYSTGNIVGTIMDANDTEVVPAPAKPVIEAKAGDEMIALSWKPAYTDRGISGWEYRYGETSDFDDEGDFTAVPATLADGTTAAVVNVPAGLVALAGARMMVLEDGIENGTEYTLQVRAVSEGTNVETGDTDDVDGEASDKATATPIKPTQSSLNEGGIPNPPMLGIGEAINKDLSMYFTQGAGSGDIDRYVVTVAGENNVAVTGTRADSDGARYTATGMITVTGLRAGIAVISVVGVDTEDGSDFDDVSTSFTVRVGAEPQEPVEAPAVPKNLPSFAPSSTSPGSAANYTVVFQIAKDQSVNTRQNDLVIEFHEDYSVAETIRNTSVAITTSGGSYPTPGGGIARTRTFTPEDVTVDGSEVLISLGDMDEQDDRFDYLVESGEVVTVHFRQSAGIKNPTGAGDYGGVVAVAFGDAVDIDNGDEDIKSLGTSVPHTISIDPEDGGLGEIVTVKGKGFKNGTSLTVFRDMAEDSSGIFSEKLADQMLTSEDDVLCTDAVVEDNIGVCTFEVTHPTFSAGATNVINAVDGVNATAASNKTKNFELKASILASPSGGSPGEMILVQVVDFEGTGIQQVQIGGEIYCHDSINNRLDKLVACEGGVDTQGSGSFSIEIPNWARGGIQELKVWDNAGTSASTKISLVGPQIRLTRETVVANQRISLIGTGFSPRSVIANVEDLPESHIDPMISIGGEAIDEERINDGDPVRVDNGGNWSASVDLPLSEATTAEGNRAIRVTDYPRPDIGVINVDIPDSAK